MLQHRASQLFYGAKQLTKVHFSDMKYSYLLVCVYLFVFSCPCSAKEGQNNYTIFTNSPLAGSYLFSSVSSANASTIKNENGKLPVSEKVFHTPGNALLLQYKNAAGGKWQATILEQAIKEKANFKNAGFLSFWIYHATAAAAGSMPLVQLVKEDGSLTAAFPITAEANSWKRIIMPVEIFESLNLESPNQITGIMFSQQGSDKGDEQMMYIDDIEFLSSDNAAVITETPEIASIKGYAKHINLTWNKIDNSNIHFVKIYRSVNGHDYKPLAIQQPGISFYNDATAETSKRYFYKISFVNSNYRETVQSFPVTATTNAGNNDALLTANQQ